MHQLNLQVNQPLPDGYSKQQKSKITRKQRRGKETKNYKMEDNDGLQHQILSKRESERQIGSQVSWITYHLTRLYVHWAPSTPASPSSTYQKRRNLLKLQIEYKQNNNYIKTKKTSMINRCFNSELTSIIILFTGMENNDKVHKHWEGEQQMMTAASNDLIISSESFWQGSYIGLIMEQIRNSQEDNMIQSSNPVQIWTSNSYLHDRHINVTPKAKM